MRKVLSILEDPERSQELGLYKLSAPHHETFWEKVDKSGGKGFLRCQKASKSFKILHRK
jgi:hypothetical protein